MRIRTHTHVHNPSELSISILHNIQFYQPTTTNIQRVDTKNVEWCTALAVFYDNSVCLFVCLLLLTNCQHLTMVHCMYIFCKMKTYFYMSILKYLVLIIAHLQLLKSKFDKSFGQPICTHVHVDVCVMCAPLKQHAQRTPFMPILHAAIQPKCVHSIFLSSSSLLSLLLSHKNAGVLFCLFFIFSFIHASDYIKLHSLNVYVFSSLFAIY